MGKWVKLSRRTERNIAVTALTLSGFIVSWMMDDALHRILDNFSWIFTDVLLGFATQVWVLAMSVVAVTAVLIVNYKPKWTLPLWAGMILAANTAFLLKWVFGRARPYLVDGTAAAVPALGSSFPSAHAAVAFAAASVLTEELPKQKALWYCLALIVGISRIYFGVHYLSDIVGGAILGFLTGEVAIFWAKKNKWISRPMKKKF